MKVTIIVENKYNLTELVLFGARHNYFRVNHGNNPHINFTDVNGDEEYNKVCGEFKEYMKYSTFLADCIKYNFKIKTVTVNAGAYDFSSKLLNPFKEEFKCPINQVMNTIVIDLGIYSADFM